VKSAIRFATDSKRNWGRLGDWKNRPFSFARFNVPGRVGGGSKAPFSTGNGNKNWGGANIKGLALERRTKRVNSSLEESIIKG